MPDALSDYFETAIANWFLHTTFPAAPTTLYLSLHTTDPDDTGSNETNSTDSPGYARVSIASSAWSSPVASNGGMMISNTAATGSWTAAGAWPQMAAMGIWDASTAGNFICGGPLGSPFALLNGESWYFAAGQLQITIGPTTT